MIRVTKLADYGILLMTWFAHRGTEERMTAPGLASQTRLPLPTVSKVLRILARAGLLVSHRGVHGGYSLARVPEDITAADIIVAFEGPIALTDCLSEVGPDCDVESFCGTRGNWSRINSAIRSALEAIPLSEMARPQTGWRKRMGLSLTGKEA